MIKESIQHQIDKVALTLHRLNNMWSFTGKRISFAADNYLHLHNAHELDRLFDLVCAYAAITKAVTHLTQQGYIIPDEWDRLYSNIGQSIFFTLPEALHKTKQRKFERAYRNFFAKAWRESPLPSLSV